MPRLNFLLCSGFSLISVAGVNAQNFPKNPTLQQIVGFQLNQVQNCKWSNCRLILFYINSNRLFLKLNPIKFQTLNPSFVSRCSRRRLLWKGCLMKFIQSIYHQINLMLIG